MHAAIARAHALADLSHDRGVPHRREGGADVTDLATAGLDLERSLFMHHLEPGLAAQRGVPPLTIELNRHAVPASSTAVLPSSRCTTRGASLLRRSLRASSNACGAAATTSTTAAALASSHGRRRRGAIGRNPSRSAVSPGSAATSGPAASKPCQKACCWRQASAWQGRPAASAAGFVADVPAAGLHCTGSPSATPAWPDAARVRTWSWLWPAAPRTGAPSCCDNGGRDLPTAIAAHQCTPC